MKNSARFLLLLACLAIVTFAKAQYNYKESLVMEKNIFVGFKGGVTAMDMRYSNSDLSFTNHSVLYQNPIKKVSSCFIGGFFVERSIPRYSYGIEFMVHGLNAVASEEHPHYATQDSAFYACVRIPLKIKFMEDKLFSPYLYVAPGIGTYVSDTIANIGFNGYSIWGGKTVQWGTINTSSVNLNVIAGAGVEGKVPIGLYEIRIRFEAGYNFGLLNMNASDVNFKRRMMGWEATLGVAFPLFINPSYSWFN